jgi:hypothetical protein
VGNFPLLGFLVREREICISLVEYEHLTFGEILNGIIILTWLLRRRGSGLVELMMAGTPP